jgi:hypothetical protein
MAPGSYRGYGLGTAVDAFLAAPIVEDTPNLSAILEVGILHRSFGALIICRSGVYLAHGRLVVSGPLRLARIANDPDLSIG